MLKLNTFSITARCEKTGQFGVAVSTNLPAVGSMCPFVKAEVGAIATQSFVNPYIGINGLKYLEVGMSAQEVLDHIKKEDPEPELRQFSIVDNTGQAVAFSGERCDGWYGHRVGNTYAVAGNMLVGEDTILEMEASFHKTVDLSLAERLMKALGAGQAAGGDKRGRQSAALKVVSTEDYPLVDLRVDEHSDPVNELARVYEVAQTDLFPFIESLPTIENPKGHFAFGSLDITQEDKE
ncbi:DUF1028 domain-containing protein [Salicibibacter kimchii]|uniref:DUF1028 domain-containing protein n=1 Tax=Salicibibacter kimchii TaxID=2099786 RepID=A0A345BWB5_9BACI|nr:DUF1028 domain-containing protein [Salicibibacter kimchii]AXF55246.1 DUF1028 domain-containing protein [Salicibibacter kimchii]